MSCRFAFIAPYIELADIASQVCSDLGLDWKIEVGDLAKGVKIAKQLINEGIEIIISRGGTATAIAKEVDIPVVEVEVSAFDLIRAIDSAKAKGKRLGVIGFANIVYGTKSLEKVFGVSINELMINDENELPIAIRDAMRNNIEIIIGDAVSVRWAKELGLDAVLVTSGKEAISLAFYKANEIALVRRKERIRTEQLKTILDFSYEGIIVTDAQGCISLINKAAEKIFGINSKHVLGCKSDEVLPLLPIKEVRETGNSYLGELCRFGNTLVVQNVVPVKADEEVTGVIATFQDARHLEDIETKVRQELHLKGHVAQYSFNNIVTCSPIMYKVIDQAKAFAQVDSTILITGETGTGKEILAQSIHNASKRKNGAFVAVNCAAIPESLLESELFGYEEGAFTGARKNGKKGLFEIAHGGTLFLDEIGEIPLKLQAHLLRVLQQKAIIRVGGDRVIPIDVRIIAATHRDLQQAVEEGWFRSDLYYRFNVLRLHLPPLRERPMDIPLLVRALTDKITCRIGLPSIQIDDEVIEVFQQYPWKGNIRELENVLERLMILKSGSKLELRHLKELLPEMNLEHNNYCNSLNIKLAGTLADMEKEIIMHVLERNGYDKEETCTQLGISSSTLWRRLKEWDISI